MSKFPLIGVIDYGLGNLYSVQKACEIVGFQTKVISQNKFLDNVEGIILPGVGAFGDAIQRLEHRNLIDAIKKKVDSGIPILGICLGMQLLMERSEEFGLHKGLNLISGSVVKFKVAKCEVFKIPQIQWNKVSVNSNNGVLFSDINESSFFYFLHSYYVKPENEGLISAKTTYAGLKYCSAIQNQHIFGVQFHPEKSGEQGLKILNNFKHYITNGKH